MRDSNAKAGIGRTVAARGARRGAGSRFATALAALALPALGALALAGCTHPVLGRPVIVGASVSCGVGACVPEDASTSATTSGPGAEARPGNAAADSAASAPLPVNLAIAYDALVRAPHHRPDDLGDEGTFIEPIPTLRDQVEAAVKLRPTLVLAIDALYWPLHQSIPAAVDDDARRNQRLASLDEALVLLDRIECPLVIGDVPDLGLPGSIVQSPERRLDASTRAEVNARIAAWVDERPTRALLRLSDLAIAIEQGRSIELGRARVDGAAVRDLLQSDRLHATGDGIALLTIAAIDALERRGLVEAESCITERAEALDRMETEAREARGRKRPGVFGSLSLVSLRKQFNEAIDRADDAAAAEALDQVLARLASYDTTPFPEDEVFLWLALSAARDRAPANAFPRCDAVWMRRWRSLESTATADRGHAWRTELWLELGGNLGAEEREEMVARLAETRTRLGAWDQARGEVLWSRFSRDGSTPGEWARIFPDLDESIGFARREADARLAEFDADARAAGDPTHETTSLRRLGDSVAGDGYLRLIGAFAQADQSEAERRVFLAADAAGHRRAIVATARHRRLEASKLWPQLFIVYASVHRSVGDARTLETEPRTGAPPEVPELDPRFGARAALVRVRSYEGRPMLGGDAYEGAGWLEGLRGAAFLTKERLVATGVDESGALVPIAEDEDLSATFWIDVSAPLKGWRTLDGLERPFESRPAFEKAVLAEMSRVPPPDPSFIRSATIELDGRVAHATVRIPNGHDPTTGALRWVTRDVVAAPVSIVGIVRESSDALELSSLAESPDDPAPRRSRWHVRWSESGIDFTGELVEFRDAECDRITARVVDRPFRMDWNGNAVFDAPPKSAEIKIEAVGS